MFLVQWEYIKFSWAYTFTNSYDFINILKHTYIHCLAERWTDELFGKDRCDSGLRKFISAFKVEVS